MQIYWKPKKLIRHITEDLEISSSDNSNESDEE